MKVEDGADDCSTRFVLLEHSMPAHFELKTHWDLMLDQASGLLTFQLPCLPKCNAAPGPGGAVERPSASAEILKVTRLPDHRRLYLTFEGEISGGRGHVRRLAGGTAKPCAASRFDHVAYRLTARELQATIEFVACLPTEQTELRILNWELSDV